MINPDDTTHQRSYIQRGRKRPTVYYVTKGNNMAVHDTEVYQDPVPEPVAKRYTPVPVIWEGNFSITLMPNLWERPGEKPWKPFTAHGAGVELRNHMRRSLRKLQITLPKTDIEMLEKLLYQKYGGPSTHPDTTPLVWLNHTTLEFDVAMNDIHSGINLSRYPVLVRVLRCFITDNAWRCWDKFGYYLDESKQFNSKIGGAKNPTTMPERALFTRTVSIGGIPLNPFALAISGLIYATTLERTGVKIFNPQPTKEETMIDININTDDNVQNNPAAEEVVHHAAEVPESVSSEEATTPVNESTNQKEETVNTNTNNATNANEATNQKFKAESTNNTTGTKTTIDLEAKEESSLKDKAIAVGKIGLKAAVVAGVCYGVFRGYRHFTGAGKVMVVDAASGVGDVAAGVTEGIAENAQNVAEAFKAIGSLFKRG